MMLMTPLVLSGCADEDVAAVNRPTSPVSDAQPTNEATNEADAAKEAKAKHAAAAAKTADAADAYWRIITKFNPARVVYNKVVNQRSHPPAVPESFRAVARTLSAAETTKVAELRAYGSWPQSERAW
jgi:hypothetical protein